MTTTGRATPSGWATMSRRVRRGARAVRWYVTSMMGDRAYADYLAHHGAAHPGAASLDERAFWRERYARQDADPGSRCC